MQNLFHFFVVQFQFLLLFLPRKTGVCLLCAFRFRPSAPGEAGMLLPLKSNTPGGRRVVIILFRPL